MDKAVFVAQRLEPLIKAIFPEVRTLDYVIYPDGREKVTLRYVYYAGKRSVNVTGDSLLSITEDVLREAR